jgi:hypothetical protein
MDNYTQAPINMAWLRYKKAILEPDNYKTQTVQCGIVVYEKPLLARRCPKCQSEEFRQIVESQSTVALAICLGCFSICSLV